MEARLDAGVLLLGVCSALVLLLLLFLLEDLFGVSGLLLSFLFGVVLFDLGLLMLLVVLKETDGALFFGDFDLGDFFGVSFSSVT